MWQSLTKDEKCRYKELAKFGKDRPYFKFEIDKERYLNELKELTRSNQAIDRPKKPLTPYMLFVRAVRLIFELKIRIDSTQSCERSSQHPRS